MKNRWLDLTYHYTVTNYTECMAEIRVVATTPIGIMSGSGRRKYFETHEETRFYLQPFSWGQTTALKKEHLAQIFTSSQEIHVQVYLYRSYFLDRDEWYDPTLVLDKDYTIQSVIPIVKRWGK